MQPPPPEVTAETEPLLSRLERSAHTPVPRAAAARGMQRSCVAGFRKLHGLGLETGGRRSHRSRTRDARVPT